MPYNSFPSYNYSGYPTNSYQQQYSQAQNQQAAAYWQQQPQQTKLGIEWVDGEVGAKAYQLPAGWPANAPMPLWDTNDTVIYLKSINQMGMPNPIQKIRYTMEEQPRQPAAMSGQAMLPGGDQRNAQDMGQYVKRDELEQMKDELKAAISAAAEKGARANAKSAV